MYIVAKDEDNNQNGQEETTMGPRGNPKKLTRHIMDELQSFYSSLQFIWRDWNFSFLLLTFCFAALGRQSMAFLVLYASKKYGWSIAEVFRFHLNLQSFTEPLLTTHLKASYLYSLRSAVNLLLFMAILPLLAKLFTQRLGMPVARKDLVLSQGQGLIMVLGMLMISLSQSRWLLIVGVAVMALGTGFHVTVRSLVTSLASPRQYGTLYAAIALCQAAGAVIAGPVLAATFHWGLTLGPVWFGLPFLFAAGFYLVGLISMALVRLPAKIDD
jgi:MFS family permease